MERHIKWQSNGSLTQIVKPGTMRFLDFARLQLAKGEQYSASTGDREWALDIFSGTASVTVEGPDGAKKEFRQAGQRENVFAGPPAMIYMPPSSKYTITGLSEAFDAGLFSAASKAKTPATLVEGSDVVLNDAGRDNWRRKVYTAIGNNVKADRLIAGETVNPPGNWSSYPPHKHDRSNPPNEAVMEEIYFFRLRPSQGYGFIWTYTAPDDPEGFSTVFVVEDGDTVLLPKGYHPVVAAPGYELHYTWVLAGEERRYGAWSDDPRHAWVKGQ
ncbi:MAG TPA: 5-deoxy-glucuronate isomerase [Terriglobia bacterium]|nr:5-deoxy-glucuronate isomerase [Terriglobia bacterium]